MEIVPRSDINLAEIPVGALSMRTRGKLSCMLNELKLLLSPKPRLYRDYRGLGNLMGINVNCWFPTNDHVQGLLTIWIERSDATLAKLQTFFEQIDRYDVLDDTNEMFYDDAAEYIRQEKNNPWGSTRPTYPILTEDCRIHPVHRYDAFILYVEEDLEFAITLIKRLESEYKFKLFVKDRDLIPGTAFENKAMIRLFSERCNVLMVILSDDFFDSDRDKFFHDHVQFRSNERNGDIRIFPIIYKDCTRIGEYGGYHKLDYRKNNEIVDFWGKLETSIRIANNQKRALSHSETLPRTDKMAIENGTESSASSSRESPTPSISSPDVPTEELPTSSNSLSDNPDGEVGKKKKKKKAIKKMCESITQTLINHLSRSKDKHAK